jgi:lysophospholipase L1-like esterase
MVMLFGDSMLGRFTKPRILQLEHELRSAATVYNCAAGGWDSSDCAPRAAVLARLAPAVVVVSLGANDCAPWKRVAPAAFAENVATVVEAFRGSAVVGFLPPVIREVDGPGTGRRSNADLDRYREILRTAVGPAACVDLATVLADVDFAPLEEDGLHLTAEGYAAVIPALARVVERGLPAGAASA